MQHEASLNQRQVERLSVVAHHGAGAVRDLAHRLEQRAFRRKARQKELTDAEPAAVKPRAADEKRVGACPAGESGRFEIDEEQVREARAAPKPRSGEGGAAEER